VVAELLARKLTPVEVADAGEGGGAVSAAGGLAEVWSRVRGVSQPGRAGEEGAAQGGRRVGARALAGAYGQLSDLLRAGVPLLRGLTLLAAGKSSPAVAEAFAHLARGVAEGTDLAEAMAQRGRVFPAFHVAMVRAGERGGFLGPVLARLSKLVLGQAELKAKVIGNLVYPGLLAVTGVGILGLIFGVFIPKFRGVFDRMETGALTNVVLGASTLVSGYGVYLLVVAALAGVGLWRAGRAERVKAWWGRAQLRLPVVGPLVRSIGAARLCRILGTMLANGVPMLAALSIARDAAGNPVFAEAVTRASDAVRQGQRLAEPLKESGLFGEDVVEMIAVGEAANSLDEVLVTIADTLEGRVERLLSGAVKLIEPVLLIVLAVVIALVALALILPMTKISQSV
jgi:general secretion pathway protein F/type IV pilus assembly protein PilC